MIRRPPRSTLFPTRRSSDLYERSRPTAGKSERRPRRTSGGRRGGDGRAGGSQTGERRLVGVGDRGACGDWGEDALAAAQDAVRGGGGRDEPEPRGGALRAPRRPRQEGGGAGVRASHRALRVARRGRRCLSRRPRADSEVAGIVRFRPAPPRGGTSAGGDGVGLPVDPAYSSEEG